MHSPRLFAYGTLLHPTGHPEVDAALQEYAVLRGVAVLAGRLYSLGAYPAAVVSAGGHASGEPEGRVLGRLFDVIDAERLFPILDAYEDYDARRPGLAEFAPATVWVQQGEARIEALCYLYQPSTVGLTPIPSGDWLQWRSEANEAPAHLITPAMAEGLIARSLRYYGITEVTLDKAVGRVLAETLFADRDMPPYDRVAMDGIALSGQAWESGRREFKILGSQLAGEPRKTLLDASGCLRIMTGAILPTGCDRVIRIEDVTVTTDPADGLESASLAADLKIPAGKNIHGRASDRRDGEPVLPGGALLRAPEIGVAASIGCENLPVFRRPRVAVIATGDELVAVGAQPLEHQVRLSNGPALVAALQGIAESVNLYHLPDDAEKLSTGLALALESCDVLIVTGGVSMGEKDLVPKAFHSVGIGEVFHKIQQKPGKPMWFGLTSATTPGGPGRTVFGLPGNPVSVLLCFRRYVLPVLRRSSGHAPEVREEALLDGSWKLGSKNFSVMAACHTNRDSEGRLWAKPVSNQGSGDFAALAGTDGFIVLDPNRLPTQNEDAFPAGFGGHYFPWTA